PALPEVFLLAHVLANPAAEDEEQVAETIEVAQRPFADGLHARERQALALGAAAHGARLVQEAVDGPAAGEDEGLQRREIFLAAVHDLLELGDFLLADLEHAFV